MSGHPNVQEYVDKLREALDGLVLLEQPRPAAEGLLELGQSLEIVSHNAVVAAARSLAQLHYPGASQFLHAYTNLVSEFWPAVAVEDWQVEFLDERRAAKLRPAALYMLASFLTQLSRHMREAVPAGAIGGGPDRNPPLRAFLNLVRIVHRDSRDKIKEVILTDPYIFADVGEDNVTGGFEGAIEYLRAVGLEPEHTFTLKVTPSPRRATRNAAAVFERCIRTAFPNATVARFASGCTFHDRFYLIRYSRGQLKGVFGPSLNALRASSIVIMGAIGVQDLALLSRWL